jgi:hypothetical protein
MELMCLDVLWNIAAEPYSPGGGQVKVEEMTSRRLLPEAWYPMSTADSKPREFTKVWTLYNKFGASCDCVIGLYTPD